MSSMSRQCYSVSLVFRFSEHLFNIEPSIYSLHTIWLYIDNDLYGSVLFDTSNELALSHYSLLRFRVFIMYSMSKNLIHPENEVISFTLQTRFIETKLRSK